MRENSSWVMSSTSVPRSWRMLSLRPTVSFGAFSSRMANAPATWGVAIGLVYLAARIIYAVQYISDPKTRAFGAGLSFLSVIVLVVGCIVGVVRIALTT